MKIIRRKADKTALYLFQDGEHIEINDHMMYNPLIALDIKDATHEVVENVPEPPIWAGGALQYDGAWSVINQDLIDARMNEIAKELLVVDAARIAALWQAAHDYEYAEVSGSAVGLLAIGVLQSFPKCLAVQAWIKSIWELYYSRKFGTSTDTDFSGCGTCPHSVPELMEEMGL